jgi:hypothetical protein
LPREEVDEDACLRSTKHRRVDASPAVQRIRAIATVEPVVAVTAIEGVVTILSGQVIIAAAADKHVCDIVSIQSVVINRTGEVLDAVERVACGIAAGGLVGLERYQNRG